MWNIQCFFAQQLACLLFLCGAQCDELSWNQGEIFIYSLIFCSSVLFASRILCNSFFQFSTRFLSKWSTQVASRILFFARGFDFSAPSQWNDDSYRTNVNNLPLPWTRFTKTSSSTCWGRHLLCPPVNVTRTSYFHTVLWVTFTT